MKRILFSQLILLFCFVSTSKADNFAPEKIEGAVTVNTVTAKLLFNRGDPFIDVRGLDDFKMEHIPGAYHLSIRNDFDERNLSDIVKKVSLLLFIVIVTAFYVWEVQLRSKKRLIGVGQIFFTTLKVLEIGNSKAIQFT